MEIVEICGVLYAPRDKMLRHAKKHEKMSCRAWAIATANICDQGGRSKLIYRASTLPILEGPHVVIVEQ